MIIVSGACHIPTLTCFQPDLWLDLGHHEEWSFPVVDEQAGHWGLFPIDPVGQGSAKQFKISIKAWTDPPTLTNWW